MKIQLIKICGMQLKKVYIGKRIALNHTFEKKDLKTIIYTSSLGNQK